jgi:hypothetical protein
MVFFKSKTGKKKPPQVRVKNEGLFAVLGAYILDLFLLLLLLLLF